MWQNPDILLNKKPDEDKLIEYGFYKKDNRYFFSKDIADGSFCFNICVTETMDTELNVTDNETGEEYSLVFSPNAVGSFIGSIRAQCERILNDVTEKCYLPSVFKSEYTKQVLKYINDKYGIKPEHLWEKSPNNAIFREGLTNKWFAAVLTVEKRKIGIDEDGEIEIIDLKESTKNISKLVDGNIYFRGYHMNKKHWYTICLDGRIPMDKIYKHIDVSFEIISSLK